MPFRIAAAVCQMNEGTSYVTEVQKKLEISPGENTIRVRSIKDRKREQKALRIRTQLFRDNRVTKKARNRKRLRNESKEDVTYASGCCLAVPALNENSVTVSTYVQFLQGGVIFHLLVLPMPPEGTLCFPTCIGLLIAFLMKKVLIADFLFTSKFVKRMQVLFITGLLMQLWQFTFLRKDCLNTQLFYRNLKWENLKYCVACKKTRTVGMGLKTSIKFATRSHTLATPPPSKKK